MMPLYKRVFPKWSKLFTSAADELPVPVPAESSNAAGNAERIEYMEV